MGSEPATRLIQHACNEVLRDHVGRPRFAGGSWKAEVPLRFRIVSPEVHFKILVNVPHLFRCFLYVITDEVVATRSIKNGRGNVL